MALVTSSLLVRPRRLAHARWFADAAVLSACAVFIFFSTRTAPIVLWDESRIAANALEMYLGGHLRLVTTYGFQPDLWNTKPPLLIWLMDLSMSLLGPSEAALRLPSALATLGSLALVISFTRRITHVWWAGALAAGLLATSLIFFGEHGARTGDYEALLTLLTTAYLYVLFFALHRRWPAVGAVLLAGGLVALAVLTKGVAGLLPGVGVPIYLLLVRRLGRPFRWPYILAALIAAASVAGFLLLRERAAPGYLHAMMFNDVAGRFGATLDRHDAPPWHYLSILLWQGAFSAGLLGACAPLALLDARGRARLGLLYSLCAPAAMLGVLSLSATKLNHYVAPACPFLAISTAIAIKVGLDALRRTQARGAVSLTTQRLLRGALAASLLLVAARAAYARFVWLPGRPVEPQAQYGMLFQALASQGAASVTVADGGVLRQGVEAAGVPADYAPQLHDYRLLARAQGLATLRVSPADLARQPARAWLATCDPALVSAVLLLGPAVEAPVGCAAVRRR